MGKANGELNYYYYDYRINARFVSKSFFASISIKIKKYTIQIYIDVFITELD